MQLSGKALATIIIGAAIAGGFIERAVSPRESLKQNSKESAVSQNDITKTITEKLNKDGSKDITTIIVDKSKIVENKETSSSLVINTPPKDWMILGGYTSSQEYILSINRRILGPVYLGAFGNSRAEFGVSVGIQF